MAELHLKFLETIPVRITAVEITFENLKDVATWVGGDICEFDEGGNRSRAVHLLGPAKEDRYGFVGDFAVQDPSSGRHYFLSSETVLARYQHVGGMVFNTDILEDIPDVQIVRTKRDNVEPVIPAFLSPEWLLQRFSRRT